MIVRPRKQDGKLELLMDINEVKIFESMLMYFSMMIPNAVTRHIAGKMSLDMGGAMMSLRLAMMNPTAAAKAQKEMDALIEDLAKRVVAGVVAAKERETQERKRQEVKEVENACKNELMADKLRLAGFGGTQ